MWAAMWLLLLLLLLVWVVIDHAVYYLGFGSCNLKYWWSVWVYTVVALK